MQRFALFFVAAGMACSDDGPTPPVANTFTIDSFNVGLAGAFIPFEAERRAAMGPALANNPADVICLQEVWREEDKDAIATAVRARFPHVARVAHDLSTPITAEIDPMCPVPPTPTTPPCGTPALRMALDEGLRCLSSNCSTRPNDEQGQTTSTACAQQRCIGQVTALVTSTESDALRCYGCLASALPTESFASIRTLCSSNPNAGLAFNGRNGLMILSRYPLSEVETLVIPGTWNRRTITRATATLPGNRRVKVYCNHLTAVFDDIAFPYTGRHGCGEVGRAGWATEQRAQGQRLVRWVNETAGTTPTVILGDFNTGPASPGVSAEVEEHFDYLRMQFVLAVPPGYRPACTFCPDNTLNGMRTEPVWIDHIFVKNIPASAVRSFERTYTEASVQVPSAPGRVHLSDHYGVRAVLSL
jgi:endonuclease/exonuclease/phosphatase family metal-dependent hydrolase